MCREVFGDEDGITHEEEVGLLVVALIFVYLSLQGVSGSNICIIARAQPLVAEYLLSGSSTERR